MSKIMKFFKRRRNGGFTMVEMVVSVALLGILVAGMTIMVAPILNSFNDTQRHLIAENVSTCIQTYVSSSMKDATNVVIFADTDYDELKSSSVVKQELKALREFCSTQSSLNKPAYTLHCISLEYDTTDQRYYVYNKTCKMGTDDEPFDTSKDALAFSECLYNDLYYTLSISKALDLDDATGATRLNDTAEISISTYSDAACNNLLFGGVGVTEFREISRDILLRSGGGSTGLAPFKFEIYKPKDDPTNPGTEVFTNSPEGYSTADATDDKRNIYIFYTNYSYDNIK